MDRWLQARTVTYFDDLRELILVEHFLSKLPDDIKQYCLDKKMDTLQECSRCADKYVALHKHPKEKFNNTANGGG